jgi:hypothetical protein
MPPFHDSLPCVDLNLAHAREQLGVEAVQLAEGDVEEVAAAAGRVEDAVA